MVCRFSWLPKLLEMRFLSFFFFFLFFSFLTIFCGKVRISEILDVRRRAARTCALPNCVKAADRDTQRALVVSLDCVAAHQLFRSESRCHIAVSIISSPFHPLFDIIPSQRTAPSSLYHILTLAAKSQLAKQLHNGPFPSTNSSHESRIALLVSSLSQRILRSRIRSPRFRFFL